NKEIVGGILFSFAKRHDSVDQSPPEVRLSEGQSVTLHCNFTTLDTSPYLFWYQQYPNQSPQHIVTKTTFDATDQALVAVEDSGMYYCAVRDTARGNAGRAKQKPPRV
uniref:Ig-like domain-containing protein n=1 Tax=Gopherus evgoodei TaxID=1825980 RepID=A0A8C5EWW8_9SAUR